LLRAGYFLELEVTTTICNFYETTITVVGTTTAAIVKFIRMLAHYRFHIRVVHFKKMTGL